MRIIGRTLIILAAASVVVGIAYGLSTTAWGESLLGGGMPGERHEVPEGLAPSDGFEGGELDPSTLADMPERGDHPDFEGGGPGGGFNLAETLKNLAVVGVIMTVVVGVSRVFAQVKKRRRRHFAPEAAA